ncbi:tetratricopeptide repeat protein [uncultured Bdellovibrio sp.]|uniref:tetratricopeptide repeat protein n=1 Tax=Bdellovibrio sp. HCB-162 TaxID=3394234 RepID=UPI0025D4C229|nr:tetratricopeptide repeat protein [uncultured Bdellovibrio sp.]
MKKIIVLLPVLTLAACATQSVNETEAPAPTAPTVTEAPVVRKEEPKPVVVEEPVRPQIPTTPSQYAALNEAIKSQSDEKIYQASTQILAQSSNDAKALNALAMYHYKRGRYDLCRYLLSKAIAGNPRMAELYSNMGIVQLAQNEKRDAIKSFRKALDINNDEAVAAANLGAIYVQEKDYSKAQVVLETAYRRGVRDPRVLNNYAIALTANRKYEKAEDLYKTILKDSASNKEALYNYATLLVDNMGKYQEGLEVINRLKFVGGPADTRNRIIALENKAKAGLK